MIMGERFMAVRDYEMEGALCIVPFGRIDRDILDMIAGELENTFGLDIMTMPAIPVPKLAYDKKRDRYNADILLNQLGDTEYPASHVLGVADVDLCLSGRNFIYGKADMVLGIAVFSITRLRQKFYGMIPNEEVFHRRALSEAVHEVGHIFGMHHCKEPYCVMFLSSTVGEIDRKGWKFCRNCRESLSQ